MGHLQYVVALLALAPLAVAGAPLDVQVDSQGQLTLHVTAAPLADVLDAIASKASMRADYLGPRPRALVTVARNSAPLAATVVDLLKTHGIDYALTLSRDGKKIETLIVTGPQRGTLAAGPVAPTAATARRAGPPPASVAKPAKAAAKPTAKAPTSDNAQQGDGNAAGVAESDVDDGADDGVPTYDPQGAQPPGVWPGEENAAPKGVAPSAVPPRAAPQ